MLRIKQVALLVLTFFLVGVTIPNPENVVNSQENKEVFIIDNVYEYDITTLDKLDTYNSFTIELNKENKLSFKLDTGEKIIEVVDVQSEVEKDVKAKLTTITAKGTLDSGESFSLRFGYDKKENTNGDLIITAPGVENAMPEEKFIRFNKNEVISLKTLHNGIVKNQIIEPRVADLPYIKAYKYGNYIFSNVQWNSPNLSDGTNFLQIKFRPLYAYFTNWTHPASGLTGTLYKPASEIDTILARYESYVTTSPYSIVSTNPIVKQTSQRNIPITLSYAGIGTEILIPIGSTNTKTDGNPARWDLKDISLDLEDSSGKTLNEFVLQGYQEADSPGSNVKIQTGIYVRIYAVYQFASIPSQWTTLVDTYNHDYINAKVQ